MSNREEFEKIMGDPTMPDMDDDIGAYEWWLFSKATSASDARYQERIKQLEEALHKIKKGQSLIGQFGSVYAIASKSLSTTTPDEALRGNDYLP